MQEPISANISKEENIVKLQGMENEGTTVRKM